MRFAVLGAVLVTWAVVATAAAEEQPRSTPSGGFDVWQGPALVHFVSAAPSQAGQTTNDYRSLPAFAVGAQGVLRFTHLRVGLAIDLTTEVFGPIDAHFGAVVGAGWTPRPPLLVELLLDAGVSCYYGVGDGVLVQGADGSAALPYAGARLGLAWRFGAKRHGVFGGWLAFHEDLMRVTVNDRASAGIYRVGGEALIMGVSIGYEQ